MDMRIVKSRQHQPSLRIDRSRLWAGQGADLLVIAQRCDPASADGNCLRRRTVLIHRSHIGIDENQIGWQSASRSLGKSRNH